MHAVIVDAAANTNPGANVVTITAGCMMGYKSALKYWHRLPNFLWGKVATTMDAHLDARLKSFNSAYKRDIGSKKRRGIMKAREGKEALSRLGYEALCQYMYQMRPNGKDLLCSVAYRLPLISCRFTSHHTAHGWVTFRSCCAMVGVYLLQPLLEVAVPHSGSN